MLDGQVSTLKNPYLVIEKVENSVTTTGSFDMIGIVKKKILFKSRPKPKAFSAKPADIEN